MFLSNWKREYGSSLAASELKDFMRYRRNEVLVDRYLKSTTFLVISINAQSLANEELAGLLLSTIQ